MPKRLSQRSCGIAAALFMLCAHARSQEPAAEDQAIETMRQLLQISAADQRRIADWVQAQLDKLTGTPQGARQEAALAFRKTLKSQYDQQANSAPFKAQLAAQTAQLAAARLGDPQADRWVSFALARTLADFNHVETLPGLLAGLKSPQDAARLLSAEGLAALRVTIVTDKKLGDVVPALRQAGVAETSPTVLSRIYVALAYPAEGATVFDAYLAVFEKRLGFRRAAPLASDGAEVEAYEFFRSPTVLGALNQQQKEQLVRAVAVFLRLDVERYNSPGLAFKEMDRLERLLDGGESILTELVGAGKGGKIRGEIDAGGHANRTQVVSEGYKWFGNPGANEAGALNGAPWNVPIGAP